MRAQKREGTQSMTGEERGAAPNRGEIAYAFLKHLLKEQGFDLDQNFRRRVGNVAKKTGIPFPTMLEFSIDLVKDLLEEVSDKAKPATQEELESDFCRGGH